MEDNRYLLVECYLNDEYCEYLSEKDEFLTYKLKEIVFDRDIFVYYHCCSEMKCEHLASGSMYNEKEQQIFIKVSYNGELSKEEKITISKDIRESLVYPDYPFIENKEGLMDKDYEVVDINYYLPVKYVQFVKLDDELIVYNSNQLVELESEDDWL